MVEKSEKGKKPAPKEPQERSGPRERSARSRFGRSIDLTDLKELFDQQMKEVSGGSSMAWGELASLMREHNLNAKLEVDKDTDELVVRIRLPDSDTYMGCYRMLKTEDGRLVPGDAPSRTFDPSKRAKIRFEQEAGTPDGARDLVVRVPLIAPETEEIDPLEVGAAPFYGVHKKPPIFRSMISAEDAGSDPIEIFEKDISAVNRFRKADDGTLVWGDSSEAFDPSKRRINWLEPEAGTSKDQKKKPDQG